MRVSAVIREARLVGPDVEIAGMTADSRKVKPGYLFAALPGTKAQGSAFVGDAIAAGAVAVLGAPGIDVPANVARIDADNPRRALALAAARYFAKQPATIAAVTGTNGKTSVASFARQIWALMGRRAASLGTLGLVAPGRERPGALTTPDPIALHEDLAGLAEDGVDHVAMEASSHGLDQYRLDGVELRAAAFTNLTHEHLDYHPSMDAYRDAKARLFAELLPADGAAVLNADAPAFAFFAGVARQRGQRLIDFGRRAGIIRLRSATPNAHGQSLQLAIEGHLHTVELGLVAEFQAMNVLAALGLVVGCGASWADAVATLPWLKGVRGRIEHVATRRNGAAVYVDYAHKPDALATVLEALRPHAKRLVVVFGCGGDRDTAKRPMMGEIATRLTDRAIVTDDNPRSEDPAAIRRAIMAAAPGAEEIGNRGRAIAAAVTKLEAGDVLVIAGKGHEQGQIVGKVVHPFDDADVARNAVAAADGAAE
jgi:UDP-N-acetylmuramoyl-L-alanyl-D-glutamate--2,6-diaminopimelate ligase